MQRPVLVTRRTACAQLAAAIAAPWLRSRGTSAAEPGAPATVAADKNIGQQTQLFVDDHVVAESQHLTRILHPAQKANAGQPIRFWKRDAQGNRVPMLASIYASPVYDAERNVFRMWSRVYPGLTKSRDLPGTEIHKHMRYGYSES